jgi:SPP1 gp7 family putative phage head morphogenesis protein
VRRYRAAAAAVKRYTRQVRTWLLDQFDAIPVNVTEVTTNDARYQVNERVYEYQISVPELRALITELQRRLGETPSEAIIQAAVEAYREGTGIAVAELAGLTSAYTRELATVLTSDPWQRRVALIESRIFEAMEGFHGETGRELARVLGQAVEIGQNPMEAKKAIRQRFKVSDTRAERIARSEITTAYRRAKLDESEDARERLGIRTMELHLSALLPTTRATHAARHGNLYTPQEAREWWAQDANSINCRCSVTSILVDEDGNPTTPALVDRVRAMK